MLLFSFQIVAQTDSINQVKLKKKWVTYSTAGVYGASIVGLHQLWYKDYEQSKFHFFNDNNQWQKVDKLGHLYSTYFLSRYNAKFLKWGGYSDREAALYASGGAFLYLSAIELMDAHSEKWGFSWGDFTANSLGIGLYLSQEFGLNQQMFKLKYSYHTTKYREQNPSLLGENELQATLKDYNGQTYWLSFNLNTIANSINPKWLNLAIGYGAEGMVKAEETMVYPHQRQYFLSLDIDFEKIETEKKWVKTALTLLNCLKVPAPALEMNSDKSPGFHWLYF